MFIWSVVYSLCLSVCPSSLCPQHRPGIHLQCHVGHYDNGCNSLPPGAPQPSHCSPGGRPARCAASLPSPKGNCLNNEWSGKHGPTQTEADLSQHINCKQTHLLSLITNSYREQTNWIHVFDFSLCMHAFSCTR